VSLHGKKGLGKKTKNHCDKILVHLKEFRPKEGWKTKSFQQEEI
jgi:hypothetical protein